ncbi:glutathione hydrolase 7 [Eucyclogobius newberryi]|uniref:glutathione hydrolase 7 n=1 Tax=Eucyclogobius newberryi TaxID=166745 RepID=UPI003B5AF0CC
MQSPGADVVSGYSTGSVAGKGLSPETNLGSAYSPVDYMSITSFPKLPEDDVLSGENVLKSHKEDDNVLSEQDTDPDLFLKSAHLQRLPSSASDIGPHGEGIFRETTTDPFTQECACQRDGLTVIITACLTFATAVTIALIVQINFGDPQVFNQGAVVTDVAKCTSLGLEVLEKQGSSVDAAIAAALCLGVVHPHTSGIGGGGVMLVHEIRKNETRVIDFRETAPSTITETMLQTTLDAKPGLLVGVPGMLSGMNQAHQLYGRLPWKDVVTMAADVARNGFNVTHELAKALADAKNQNMSKAFEDLFFPNGLAPIAGVFGRRMDLAAVLDAVAAKGISEFYSGNLSQEIVDAVQEKGGVLDVKDLDQYSTVLRKPAEIFYQGHHVMASPAPHAGIALITALNILEGYNITNQLSRRSTFHWIAESIKIALAMASEIGDPMFDTNVSEIVAKMLSKPQASQFREMIDDSQTFPADHYTQTFTLEEGAGAAQVVVMGPDDVIVSVMSSLNRPFGSGILTTSGILLNSQILDFSWPNKTNSSTPNPHNSLQPGKRPLSFLMPTVVRPAVGLCGTYVATGSSNGEKALSGITQVLLNILSSRNNMSDSLAYGRLHPQLQPNTLLVDSEFLDKDVELLQNKGHKVERINRLSLVEGTRRINDVIIGVKDPRSVDASALNIA